MRCSEGKLPISTVCKQCGAKIFWVRSETGSQVMALDEKPDLRGNMVLGFDQEGNTVTFRVRNKAAHRSKPFASPIYKLHQCKPAKGGRK